MVKTTVETQIVMGSKLLSGTFVSTDNILLAGPGPGARLGVRASEARLAVTVTVTPKSTVTLHRITAGSGQGSEQALANMLFPSQPGK